MAQGTAVAESRKVGDAGLVTAGIDVSDRYSQLCVLGDDGEIVREERVRTTTAALTRALAGMTGARVVLEVGPRSPWLSRMLSELGHDVIVANPRQVKLIARSQRKNDRSDAEHLARLGRFDPKLLFPIRHRGATAQADLQVLRSRDALVRARTALINHVRGAVKAWGAALPSCTTPAFHRTVEAHIPEELRPALLPLLGQIEQLTGAIRRADQEIAAMCERYTETAALRQIVGVGPITSLTFILTIEDPARFPKNRAVGPYLGLVPRSRDSGDRQPQLRITKDGDVALRRVLNQAAHYILGPFGPDSDLRRWGLRYAESGAGNAKKRAVVAVARRLAVLLLALGEVYDPLRQARAAEAASSRQHARSGATGRPRLRRMRQMRYPGDCGSGWSQRGRQLDCSAHTLETGCPSCTGPGAAPRRVRMEAWPTRLPGDVTTAPLASVPTITCQQPTWELQLAGSLQQHLLA